MPWIPPYVRRMLDPTKPVTVTLYVDDYGFAHAVDSLGRPITKPSTVHADVWQAAIDYAGKVGGLILVKPGTYNISKKILIDNPVEIVGELAVNRWGLNNKIGVVLKPTTSLDSQDYEANRGFVRDVIFENVVVKDMEKCIQLHGNVFDVTFIHVGAYTRYSGGKGITLTRATAYVGTPRPNEVYIINPGLYSESGVAFETFANTGYAKIYGGWIGTKSGVALQAGYNVHAYGTSVEGISTAEGIGVKVVSRNVILFLDYVSYLNIGVEIGDGSSVPADGYEILIGEMNNVATGIHVTSGGTRKGKIVVKLWSSVTTKVNDERASVDGVREVNYGANGGLEAITTDGTLTQFTIAHGLPIRPNKVIVTPKGNAPKPDTIDWDDNNIYLNFGTAPAAGTYYYSWYAEV